MNQKDIENRDCILQQWQTCVEMADSVSSRRDSMNNLFATIHVAIVAAISFVWDIKMMILGAAGIALAIVWLLFIRYYKNLNTVKYDIINEIEKQLPVQPFSDEWKGLTKIKRYTQGTTLEKVMPWAFIVIYVVAMIIMIKGRIFQ